MALRLTALQIAMLDEMGITWPALVPASNRELHWIAVTSCAPTDAHARLLRNILRAIETFLASSTEVLALDDA